MKKHYSSIILGLLGASLTLSGCDLSSVQIAVSLKLSDPMAFDYHVGDIFDNYIDNGGLSVEVNMSDNTTLSAKKGSFTYVIKEKNSENNIDPTKPFDKVGNYVVTVTKDKLASVSENIIVSKIDVDPATLTSITLSDFTTSVYLNETYTYDGKVTAHYSDDTTKDISISRCTVVSPKTNVLGSSNGEVSYSENGVVAKASFSVSVIEKPVEKVTLQSIEANNFTRSVYQGETYEFDGKVIAKFSDNSEVDVTKEANIGTISTLNVGNQILSISYTYEGVSKSTQEIIEVKEKEIEKVVLDHIEAIDYTESVYKGEPYEFDGKVIAYYSDTSTKDVTEDAGIGTISTSSTGIKPLLIAYYEDGINKTYEVSILVREKEVEEVTLISIEAINYSGKVYQYSEYKFNGQVIAHYSDGSQKDVTNEATIGTISTTNLGSQRLDISFEDEYTIQTIPVYITVIKEDVVELISIESYGFPQIIVQDSIYSYGEGIVYANYSNNTYKDVTELCEFSNVDTSVVGPTTLTISYTENEITKNDYVQIEITEKEDPVVPVESVSLKTKSLNLTVGEFTTLVATVLPENATNKTVLWNSYNKSVATVDSNGLVTAIGEGTTTISVKTVDGEYEAYCSVKVSPKEDDYETITVSEAVSIIEGLEDGVPSDKEYYVRGIASSVDKDQNGFNGDFLNSNLKFRSVNGNGVASSIDEIEGNEIVVFGYLELYHEIYQIPYLPAYASPTGAKYNPKLISVTPIGGDETIDATNISVSPVSKIIDVGESATLSATVMPENATNKTVTWSSSDNSVCTVSNSGVIKGVSVGNAVITAKTHNNISTTCNVTVQKQSVDPIEGDKFKIEFNHFESDGQTELTTSTILEQITSGSQYIDSFTDVYKVFKGINGLKFGSNRASGSLSFEVCDEIKELECSEIILDVAQYGSNSTTVSVYADNEQVVLGSSSDSKIIGEFSEPRAISEIEISASSRAYLSGITIVCEQIEKIPVESIAISGSKNLSVGNSEQLDISYTPANANTGKTITWKSSSNSVATVSNGLVTGISEGNATITATSQNGCIATIDVVVSRVKVTGVSLSLTSCVVALNTTKQLTATVSPSNATDKLVSWKSSNTSVATVSSTGLITAEAVGSTTITATTNDGDFIATCSVSVEKVSVTSVSLDSKSETLRINGTKQLTATVNPEDATDKSVSWNSSNTSVATVSSTGLVTAKAAGNATITVTTTDGKKTATCSITVEEAKLDAWTILIYMCGADLESESGLATSDIKEILSVANQPDDVNIVIETGGSKSWSLGSSYIDGATKIDSSKLTRWHIENKKLTFDESLSTYTSMGSASTLQSFVEYGLTEYPADKTGVIFWNHGGAMYGCCYDEKKNDDSLLNSEMKSAFSKALANTGSSKLEFVGYDTCLTQVQDIAEFNSNYFNYMIASEEAESGYGWDYDTWVDDLYAKSSTSTILTAIVDGFIKDNGGVNSTRSDQTLSWLDLSKMSAYKTAFENFASAMSSQLSKNSITKKTFASWMSSNVKAFCVDSDSSETYYCLFDVKDMLSKISSNSTYNPGSSYVSALNTAFSNLVKYSVAQKGAGNAYGLGCIYSQGSSDARYIREVYTSSETNFSNWLSFLTTYSYLGK